MRHPDVKLIIFARAPEVGKTKTRLIPALGAEAAAELYRRMSQHIIDCMQQAQLCDVGIQCYPDSQHPFFAGLLNKYCIELNRQQGNNLGERMSSAFHTALSQYKHAIIIGTDAPAINIDYVASAIEQLKSGTDVVLGPAQDGGYVLIGLNKANPHLFKEIDWGTHHVLKQTLQRAEDANLSIHLLKTLWDVDIAEDLTHLRQRAELAHLLTELEIKPESAAT